jgi:regulator of replication initiation timing
MQRVEYSKEEIDNIILNNKQLESENKNLKLENKELKQAFSLKDVGNWFNGLKETPSEERLEFSRFVLVKNNNGLYKVDRYDYLHNMWMSSAWDKNETKWIELPS